MTTKSAPKAPEAVETPAAPVQRKPFAIRIQAPAHEAFNQAIVLARSGYTFSDEPVTMAPNGWAFFTLVLGSPDILYELKASESEQLSRDAEEREHQRQVREEAKRLMEQAKRDELEQQVAALKAQQAETIRKLEEATAAAIASLK